MDEDKQRRIVITRDFDYKDPIGHLCLRDDIEITPDSLISFAFEKFSGEWRVIGCGLIHGNPESDVERRANA
jgi:hypothetical protein